MLYYPRFEGDYFPYNQAASSFYCKFQSWECTSSSSINSMCLNAYSNFTSISNTSVTSPSFFQCSNGIYAELFEYNFVNVPLHSNIVIQFDGLVLNQWKSQDLAFVYIDYTTDQNNQISFDFSGESQCDPADASISRTFHYMNQLSHTQNTLNLRFRANFTSPSKLSQSLVIRNLQVYLMNPFCDVSCFACDQSNICVTCPFNSFLSSGICICKDGWYMETTNYTRCVECDIFCKTCNGPDPTSCIICANEIGNASGLNCVPFSSCYIFIIK